MGAETRPRLIFQFKCSISDTISARYQNNRLVLVHGFCRVNMLKRDRLSSRFNALVNENEAKETTCIRNDRYNNHMEH